MVAAFVCRTMMVPAPENAPVGEVKLDGGTTLNRRVSLRKLSEWLPTPAGIAVIYAVLGGLWILLSDSVVAFLIEDPVVLSRVQTAKGWFYVALTSWLLYGLVRRSLAVIRRSEERLRERTRALALLQQISQRRASELQSILDNMVEGVFTCDLDGRLTLANEAGLRMLGLAGSGEVGQALTSAPELLQTRHHDGRPFVSAELPLARALQGETVESVRQRVHNPVTRRDIHIRSSAAPIRDEAGGIVGALLVASDVTELAELDRLKQEFVFLVSHEFRTPLTVVIGYLDIALRHLTTIEGDLAQRAASRVGSAKAAGWRLVTMVEQLLDVSALEAGKLELRREEIDMPQLIRQVVAQRSPRVAQQELAVVVPATFPGVLGDRARVAQIVANLIANAAKYSPRGTRAEVRLERRGNEAVVSVRDQGPGIAPEQVPCLFDRFCRLQESDMGLREGLGLGLHINRRIVEALGGQMWVESELGRGTVFYFSLPLLERKGTGNS